MGQGWGGRSEGDEARGNGVMANEARTSGEEPGARAWGQRGRSKRAGARRQERRGKNEVAGAKERS